MAKGFRIYITNLLDHIIKSIDINFLHFGLAYWLHEKIEKSYCHFFDIYSKNYVETTNYRKWVHIQAENVVFSIVTYVGQIVETLENIVEIFNPEMLFKFAQLLYGFPWYDLDQI